MDPAHEHGINRLTPRQREILELVAKGLTNNEIGGVLHISVTTVRTHLAALFAQLDVTNRTEAASQYHAHAVHARPERVSAVLARPAIAVLPLAALDEDTRTRTASGGLSADLAGLFSRWCWFPVIAQVSTAQARTLGPTNQHIAAALGARFVVDGSLRLSGGAFRLAVQVDDAETGHVLWTERCDFPVSDLFAVQDAVCASIVAAAYPVMIERVQSGLRDPPRPCDLACWELAHRAMELCAQREQVAAAQARSHLSAALARDPTLVLAHYAQGLVAYDEVLNQWGPEEVARDRLLTAASRCIELAPHVGEGHFLQARYFQTRGDHARAVPLLQAAIARNPSYAQAHALLAQTLHLIGRSDEALRSMENALRLGPRAFVAGLALLHFMRGEYAEAQAGAEIAVSHSPRYTFARAVAAASAHLIGDRASAAEHGRRLRTDYPAFVPHRLLRAFGPEVDSLRRLSSALEALGVRP